MQQNNKQNISVTSSPIA